MNLDSIPQIFFPISEKDTQDSYVYGSTVSDLVSKIYKGNDADCLWEYSLLQNEFTQDSVQIDLPQEYFYRGESFSQIAVSVLELPEESYSACFIGKGPNHRKEVMITTPSHVRGENLKKIIDESDDKVLTEEALDTIGPMLSDFMRNASSSHAIEMAEVISENITICGVNQGVMKIVITDVSANIPGFVKWNPNC